MAAVITLVHGGGAVADAVMLAHATRRIIREDLGWPFGYNLLLVRLSERGSQCRRRAWLVGPGPGGDWYWVMCRSSGPPFCVRVRLPAHGRAGLARPRRLAGRRWVRARPPARASAVGG